jgi:hypothetical protein
MVVKIIKGVWFLSLLATTAVFLYVYASLPENILVREGEVPQFISRNGIFYITLIMLAVFNSFVIIISRLFSDQRDYFKAWFYVLVIFLNLFIIVALQYLNLYNSGEKFNYGSIGLIIYGSIALLVLWSSLWPIYFLGQRFLSK